MFIFLDSFDHYCAGFFVASPSELTLGSVGQKWIITPFQASITNGIAGRNTGGFGTQLNQGSTGSTTFDLNIPNLKTIAVGVAMKWNLLGGSNNGFFHVGDNRTNPPVLTNMDVNFLMNSDGTITIIGGRGQGGDNLIGRTLQAISPAQGYNFFEMTIVIDQVNGSVVLKVNGNTWFSKSGIQTDYSGRATLPLIPFLGSANYLEFTGSNGAMEYVLDDLYVNDTQTFGDLQIRPLFTNAFGTHQDWQPSPGGTTNWQQYGVTHDKPCSDYDTTFIASQVGGQLETDFYETDVTTDLVYTVQQLALCTNTGGSQHTISPMIRQAGIDYIAPAGFYPTPAPIPVPFQTFEEATPQSIVTGQGYLYQRAVFDKDPTGAAWTPTNINADQWGWDLVQ